MPDNQDIDWDILEDCGDAGDPETGRDPNDNIGLDLPPLFAFLPLCLMR
jgi:hypothetical protein